MAKKDVGESLMTTKTPRTMFLHQPSPTYFCHNYLPLFLAISSLLSGCGFFSTWRLGGGFFLDHKQAIESCILAASHLVLSTQQPISPTVAPPNTTQLLMVDGLFYLSDSRAMVVLVVLPIRVSIFYFYLKKSIYGLFCNKRFLFYLSSPATFVVAGRCSWSPSALWSHILIIFSIVVNASATASRSFWFPGPPASIIHCMPYRLPLRT